MIIYWRGLWDILYLIPIVDNPFVSLFIGLTVITLSGVVFAQFDPLKAKTTKIMNLLNDIASHKHMKEEDYELWYHDETTDEIHPVGHHNIKKLEHNFVVTEVDGKEFFIPVHRLRHVKQKGVTIWKK